MKFGNLDVIDIFFNIIALILLALMAWVAWESNVMVSEKKERQRRGLTDYYDNPIEKDEK